jgi:hypothetical protein
MHKKCSRAFAPSGFCIFLFSTNLNNTFILYSYLLPEVMLCAAVEFEGRLARNNSLHHGGARNKLVLHFYTTLYNTYIKPITVTRVK